MLATDAPLLPGQCARLAQRATMGIARTGGVGEHFSGDIFLAFATGNRGLPFGDYSEQVAVSTPIEMYADAYMTHLFDAAVEATEEAIINALFAADTMVGYATTTRSSLCPRSGRSDPPPLQPPRRRRVGPRSRRAWLAFLARRIGPGREWGGRVTEISSSSGLDGGSGVWSARCAERIGGARGATGDAFLRIGGWHGAKSRGRPPTSAADRPGGSCISSSAAPHSASRTGSPIAPCASSMASAAQPFRPAATAAAVRAPITGAGSTDPPGPN